MRAELNALRVLIATQHLTIIGGAEKYLQEVVSQFVERDHVIGIVHADNPKHENDTLERGNHNCIKWSLLDGKLERILELVEKWAPDVVYWHNLQSFDFENAMISRYPAVLYLHDYRGICATGSKMYSFPIIRPCERKFGAACLLLHYPRRCGGLNPITAISQYRLQARRNRCLHRYRAVLVASTHMFGQVRKNGVHPPQLVRLPHPLTDFAPQSRQPVLRSPKGQILFIGRLTKLKGLDYLFAAMLIAGKTLGYPLKLRVAGTGPQEALLQEKAKKSGLDVNFLGWVNHENRLRLLNDSDLLAVPSLWPEPYGLVGLEAACFGVPSVAYAVGGIRDWLIGGETGELAPGDPPTVEGLADALVLALKDFAHYNELRIGSWKRAREKTRQEHITKLETIFENALTRPNRDKS